MNNTQAIYTTEGLFGYKATVYPNFIQYSILWGLMKQLIFIKSIATIEFQSILRSIDIVTFAGQRHKIPVRKNEKQELVDAISGAMLEWKNQHPHE